MAQVRSFDALKALKVSAQLQEGMDFIPDKLQDLVVPVIDITPRTHRVCNIVRRGVSGTIYTTPTDGDFFLTTITLGLIKDATHTGSACAVYIYIDGVSQAVIQIPCITSSVQSDTQTISFPFPVKCDRGTTIAYGTTGTFGAICCTLTGYTVMNTQGN